MTIECSRLRQLRFGRQINLAGTILAEPIREYCLALDSMMYSSTALHLGQLSAPRGTEINMPGKTSVGVSLPFFQFLPASVFKRPPPRCYLKLRENSEIVDDRALPPEHVASIIEEAGERKFVTNVKGHDTIANNTIRGAFVMYFERYREDLDSHFSHNLSKWEPNWLFAWAIRNGLVHDGKIYWNDKNRDPVSWQGITIGHANNGEEVLDNLVGATELICLMVDMCLALDHLRLGPSPGRLLSNIRQGVRR